MLSDIPPLITVKMTIEKHNKANNTSSAQNHTANAPPLQYTHTPCKMYAYQLNLVVSVCESREL